MAFAVENPWQTIEYAGLWIGDNMRAAFDIMGGDNAPDAIVKGALDFARAYPHDDVILVGTEEVLDNLKAVPANARAVVCGSVMAMDEDVRSLLKKKDSSIWVATEMVKKGEADAVISAGSTGAQMASATLLLGRLKGCERPAISIIVPTPEGPKLLLDAGANADCTPELLLSFAKMGDVYARQLLDYAEPRVGLLTNGTEDHKGNKLTAAAYALIKESGLNFLGNREGRDIMTGGYEVMVCDGMSGNIAIKSMEGAMSVMMSLLKKELTASLKTKIGALLIKDGLHNVKHFLDVDNYGGAPLLGVNGISVVCHGSSIAKTIFKAGEAAQKCYNSDFVNKLASAL